MLAVLGSHTGCVGLLLERDATPDAGDKWGRTALHRAVGGRPRPRSGTRRLPQALARCGTVGFARSVEQVCDWPPGSPRQAAVGCEDCVLVLLEHEAYVLCRDIRGRTPLHLAASCGHTELLSCLLQAAARTDPLDPLLDYSGFSPLHWAAYHGEPLCRAASVGPHLPSAVLGMETALDVNPLAA